MMLSSIHVLLSLVMIGLTVFTTNKLSLLSNMVALPASVILIRPRGILAVAVFHVYEVVIVARLLTIDVHVVPPFAEY